MACCLVCSFIPVYVGKVIGRHGNVITDILEKSRVNNVKVVGDEEARKRGIDTGGDVSGYHKKCINILFWSRVESSI